MIDSIAQGIASVLWGCSWAEHVEEHQCQNLSGCEITECMPEIRIEAWIMAGELIGRIVQANGKGMALLLKDACDADGVAFPPNDAYQERFGNCLAYMATGAGVSWYDDHSEEFDIIIPDFEEHELRVLADETCEDEGYAACPTCSAYNRPGKLKCGNCSAELPVADAPDTDDYEMCRHCQHFVEENDAYEPGSDIARHVHLDDGTPEYDHDASPSGDIRSGDEWASAYPFLFPYAGESTEDFLNRRKAEAHHARRGPMHEAWEKA